MAMSVVYGNFGGRIVSESRGGVERDYARDTLGSTAALLNTSGSMTDVWTYWPYGETRTRTGTSSTPFTFVGTFGYFADSTTRMYVRARHYLSATARWLTVDPLWPFESAYGYVDGMPLAWVDPSGMNKFPDWIKNYYRGRTFGPPSPRECEEMRRRLDEVERKLRKLRGRGWDNPANDPGGKQWRQGQQSGITVPGGHHVGKFLPLLEIFELLKSFIDGNCGPPPPPLEPCRVPTLDPVVEPPYIEIAAEIGLAILTLILLRGAGSGAGIPLNPVGRPVMLT
jgi:RHS repeat-associated protein